MNSVYTVLEMYLKHISKKNNVIILVCVQYLKYIQRYKYYLIDKSAYCAIK